MRDVNRGVSVQQTRYQALMPHDISMCQPSQAQLHTLCSVRHFHVCNCFSSMTCVVVQSPLTCAFMCNHL